MRRILILILLLPIFLSAQEKGIKFSNKLSWEKVKAKAKSENKFIMMDCYTSWCVPCKIMEQQVFTDRKIGEYSNQNFVTVQVQFDDDPKADEVKKEWMKFSKELDKQYHIAGYPCYLFFNPEGEIVHKAYGKRDIQNFLELLTRIPNPDFQYYSLRKLYDANKKDKKLLKKLISASMEAEPEDKQELINIYLGDNPEIKTPAEAKMISDITRSSKDKGFPILLKQADSLNALLGEVKIQDLYRSIINFEDAESKLGRVSPMGYYILTEKPNWSVFEDSLAAKYPENKVEILDFIKLNFYKKGILMDQFVPFLKDYIKKYGQTISNQKKMEYVDVIAKHSNDVELNKEMLNWSKDAFEKSDDVQNLYTYALLNYKVGEHEKGISLLEKAIENADENQLYNFNEKLELMKKGLKIQ